MSLLEKALAVVRDAWSPRVAQEVAAQEPEIGSALAQPVDGLARAASEAIAASSAPATTATIAPASTLRGLPNEFAGERVPAPGAGAAEGVPPRAAGVPAAFADAAPPPKRPAILTLAKGAEPWPPEKLSLALQGGGSFGAFAWGVLDRLLEEPEIEFDAISGSSAGAVNAVLLASGMIDGGREGARERLSRFWREISQAAAMHPHSLPLGAGLELVMRLMSPYQFNPFNVNPLREALTAEVDFERLRERSAIKLLLGATRVRDGSLRILTNEELTVDAVLASACLPLLHHAIELDGEPYWDGGYAANPPLIPLVRASESPHVLIVQVTPNMTDRLPKTTSEIAARIEQIQFNATLNSELEALKYGKIIGAADKLRRLRVGRISADDHFEGFAAESAANLRWEFLERLHLGGRAAAELWLNRELPALRRRP